MTNNHLKASRGLNLLWNAFPFTVFRMWHIHIQSNIMKRLWIKKGYVEALFQFVLCIPHTCQFWYTVHKIWYTEHKTFDKIIAD